MEPPPAKTRKKQRHEERHRERLSRAQAALNATRQALDGANESLRAARMDRGPRTPPSCALVVAPVFGGI